MQPELLNIINSELFKTLFNQAGLNNITAYSNVLSPISAMVNLATTKSLIDLANTNKELPNVDPFADYRGYNKTIGEQLKDKLKIKLFGFGGNVKSDIINAEKGEIIEAPTGEIGEIDGNYHEQGGTNIIAPEGSKIYSQRIEVDDKTMADRKKERLMKESLIERKLNKSKNDVILKNTLKRTKEINQLQDLYDIKFQDIANNVFGNISQNILKQYKTGGIVKDGYDNPPKFSSEKDVLDFFNNYDFSSINVDDITKFFENDNNFIGFKNFYNEITKENYDEKVKEASGNKNINIDEDYFVNFIRNNIGNVAGNKATYSGTHPKTFPYAFAYYYMATTNNNTKNNVSDGDNITSQVKESDITSQTTSNNAATTNNGNVSVNNQANTNAQTNITGQQNADAQQSQNILGDPNVAQMNGNPTQSKPKTFSLGFLNNLGAKLDSFLNNNNSYIKPTVGDFFGQTGTFLGMLGPMAVTLWNRSSDTPNFNFFKRYGEQGLKTNIDQITINRRIADSYLKDIDRLYDTSVNINRNSARTVNVQRALDLVSHMQAQRQREELETKLNERMNNLLAQRIQLQNEADRVRMQGDYQTDLANRQDKDVFYTNLNRDLNTAATYLQKHGADINKNIQNDIFLKTLQTMSEYGFTFGYDENGFYMIDKAGNKKYLGTPQQSQ